ncbi:MAG: hypothetical protein P1U40_11290 [Coxiellaceae bacterium]|nr:hypothetical protein [Coxiellaceae bacterium]
MKINVAPVRNNLMMFTVASTLFSSAYVASMLSKSLSTEEKDSPLLAFYGITSSAVTIIFLTLTLAALHGYLKTHTVYDTYDKFKQKYKRDHKSRSQGYPDVEQKAELKIGDCIDEYLLANPDVERVMCNMPSRELPIVSNGDEAYATFTKLLAANKILRKSAYIQWGLSALVGAILGVAAASQIPHAFTNEHGATTLRKIGIGAMITVAVFDIALSAIWCYKQRYKPKFSLNTPLMITASYGSLLDTAEPLQETPQFN